MRRLSPVGKSLCISRVNRRHLVNGDGKRVADARHMVDLVQGQRAPLARFQIFVDHLIAADVKIPRAQHQGSNQNLSDCF
jgi:hypothetical protein